MHASRPVLVFLVVGALVAVLGTLMALVQDPGMWRLACLLLAGGILAWAVVTVRQRWRAGG